MERNCEKCVDYELGGYSKPCIPCYGTKGHPNFRPKKEKPMPKLEQPTAEMVIEAGRDLDDCPEVKRAFTKLWPGAFKPEPVKMKGEIFDENGKCAVWLSTDKKTIILSSRHDWKRTEIDPINGCQRITPTRK